MTTTKTVPAGTHDAALVQSYLTITSTGKPMLTLTFEVEDLGRVAWFGFFTERATEMTCKALAALGFDLEAENFDLSQINGTDRLVGKPASIVVEEEDDGNGNVHTRVKWVNRRREKLSEDDVAALSTSLRKHAEAVKAQAEAQAEQSESDTPF